MRVRRAGDNASRPSLGPSRVRASVRMRRRRVAPGEPALKLHRGLRHADAAPLQVETAVYRADVLSYRLSLSR